MTMGFTADQVIAVTGVVTFVGGAAVTVAGWLLHQKDKAQEVAMTAQDKEVARLAASVTASWAAIDKLKEEKVAYLTRADHERWRLEMKSDMEKLGQRLVDEIEKVSKDFRADINRVMATKQDKVSA